MCVDGFECKERLWGVCSKVFFDVSLCKSNVLGSIGYVWMLYRIGVKLVNLVCSVLVFGGFWGNLCLVIS